MPSQIDPTPANTCLPACKGVQEIVYRLELLVTQLEAALAGCGGLPPKDGNPITFPFDDDRAYLTTKETAALLGRAVFTVREWARHGRINAMRAKSGRGEHGEFRIPVSEIKRFKDEGLLPPTNRQTRRLHW